MRRSLYYVYALLVLVLLARPAYSSDWLQIEDTMGGEKNYIDVKSIEYNKPFVFFKTKNIDRKLETTITRYVINCQNRTGAIRDIIIYDSSDLFVKSHSFEENRLQWGKISPRSFMRIYLKSVCKDRSD